MAYSRKKHHYIPQFHLRRFSIAENKKTIGVYNHENSQFIRSADIKHQACVKYLYGKTDEIEDALSKMDSNTGYILDITIKHLFPPPENSNASDQLKQFILFQLSRTLKAGDKINESANSTFQALFKHHKNYDEEIHKDYKMVHDQPVLLSMQYTDQFLPIIKDLACKTLINLTPIPFITSDNPIIKYNQWMESKNLYLGATGLGVKGLQIFFPIHPRVMLCWYDKTTYKYVERNSFVLETNCDEDIEQLNALQYLFSKSQLFFNDVLPEIYFMDLIKSYKSAREKVSHVTIQSEPAIIGSKRDKSYLLNSYRDPSIHLHLSFAKVQRRATKTEIPDGLPVVRKESFKDIKFKLD